MTRPISPSAPSSGPFSLCEIAERLRVAFLTQKLAVNLVVSLAVSVWRPNPSDGTQTPLTAVRQTHL